MTAHTSTPTRRPFSFDGTMNPTAATSSDPSLCPTEQVKYRVLVMEDDISISRMIGANLLKAGLEFQCVVDGVVGLRAFEELAPHLVLLDLMLPGMNGFEVCQTIRKKSSVPVIMMTARVETTHQMRGFRLGADDYVLKPFDPQILVARVIAHLRRAYRYDHVPLQTNDNSAQAHSQSKPVSFPVARQEANRTLPEGWAECGACNYMGPLQKFPRRFNGHGQNVLACPHCGIEKMVQFVVG